MKTCPKCGELNGEDRSDCYKCHAALPAQAAYRKICPKCGALYSPKKETCEECGTRLATYTTEGGVTKENSGCWMYVVSVLFPLVGIILGCIYIGRGDDELGKSLIITGIIANISAAVLGIALASCSAF